MLNFGFSLIGIEHRGIWIGPKKLLTLSHNGASNNLVLMIDVIFVAFVDHRLEELANVIGVKSG
jgi:hypothetical protein